MQIINANLSKVYIAHILKPNDLFILKPKFLNYKSAFSYDFRWHVFASIFKDISVSCHRNVYLIRKRNK